MLALNGYRLEIDPVTATDLVEKAATGNAEVTALAATGGGVPHSLSRID